MSEQSGVKKILRPSVIILAIIAVILAGAVASSLFVVDQAEWSQRFGYVHAASWISVF